MTNPQIQKLINQINAFPSLPAVVTKIMEVTSDEEATIYDLLNVIKLDQTFTVSILKAANSAFYGRVRGVGSLKDAISVLGQKEIRNIIVSKAVFNRFKDTYNRELFNIKKFWEHSFYCGVFAKNLAEKLDKNGSDFFIAGLIHDIGKLIIYFQLPEEFKLIYEASDNRLSDMYLHEKKILETTHDRIGALLLKKWLFPERLVAATGFHHSPFNSSDNIIFPIIINISDRLVHYIDNEKDETILQQVILNNEMTGFIKDFGFELTLSELQKLIEMFEIQKEESSEMLNLLFT